MKHLDGDRSRKRSWFAAKQLEILKEIDLTAKTIKLDGFLFKMWQTEGIGGYRIQSPVGLVIAKSTYSSLKIYTKDFWMGGYTGLQMGKNFFTDYFGVRMSVFDKASQESIDALFEDMLLRKEDRLGELTPEEEHLLNLLARVSLEDNERELLTAAEKSYMLLQIKNVITDTPFGLIDGETIGPDTVWEVDQSPVPSIYAFPGEGYWLSTSGLRFLDLNGNGIADRPISIYETGLNFYTDAGSALVGRKGYALESGLELSVLRMLFGLPYDGVRQVDHQIAIYETAVIDEDDLYVGCNIFTAGINESPAVERYLLRDMWPEADGINGGLPAGLRNILLTVGGPVPAWPVGGYAYAVDKTSPAVLLNAANLTNTVPWNAGSLAEEWFDDNPSQDYWKLFYSIYDGTDVAVVSPLTFIHLLAELNSDSVKAPGDKVIDPDEIEWGLISGDFDWDNILPAQWAGIQPAVNWDQARRMLRQLFPWPNPNFVPPSDSAMFHDEDFIYTFTRKYGCVKFTGERIETIEMFFPEDVDDEGVRPEMIRTGNANVQYLCVCNLPGQHITGIYHGNPFVENKWFRLPGMEQLGYVPGFVDVLLHNLVYVRPVFVSTTKITLLGIARRVEVTVEGEIVYTARYIPCFLDATLSTSESIPEGTWQLLGELPDEITTDENWSMAFFGEGEHVKQMMDFISPPHVFPQMPVGPYEKYAIGQP